MSIDLKLITRLRAIVESTFKGDATSSPGLGSFTEIPGNEGTMEVTTTALEQDPNTMVQSRLDGRVMVLGPRTATLKFTMNLAPTGVAAGASTAANPSALTMLLGAVFGGAHSGTGTTFSAGWTARTGAVASAAGLSIGDVIVRVNAAGRPEARRLKNIATNTLTVEHDFSAAPTLADVCYAGTTCYETEDPATSLQFLCSGQNSNDRWLLLGCQATALEFSVDPTGKGIPTVTFTFSAALYKESDETAGTVTGSIGDATYTYHSPIVDYQSDMRLDTAGSPAFVTANSIGISALTFKPAVSYVAVTSPPSGYDGGAPILRWRANRLAKPCEITFTLPYADQTYWQARDASVDKSMGYLIGLTPGYLIYLGVSTAQVLNPQRAASDDAIQGQTITLNARRNTVTSGSTEEAKSPLVVAVL